MWIWTYGEIEIGTCANVAFYIYPHTFSNNRNNPRSEEAAATKKKLETKAILMIMIMMMTRSYAVFLLLYWK